MCVCVCVYVCVCVFVCLCVILLIEKINAPLFDMGNGESEFYEAESGATVCKEIF